MLLSNFLISTFAALTLALPHSESALKRRDLSWDQQNALNIHNNARAAVGVGALVWDDGLTGQAQDYANTLAAQDNGLQENGASINLYASNGIDDGTPLSDGSQAWYNEISNYNYVPIGQGNFDSYGHYSKPLLMFTYLIISAKF